MGAGVRIGGNITGGPVCYAGYAQTDWVVVHSDLTATAETSTVLRTPATYSNSNVKPCRVPPWANRVLARARYSVGITAIATPAAVSLYGVYGPEAGYTESTGAFANDGTMRFMRLDSVIMSTVGTSYGIDGTNNIRDSVYKYTDVNGEISGTNLAIGCGFDLRGCSWVLPLTTTAAASITGTGTTVQLEIAFINYVPMTSVLAV
jgi:hypothetical protein